MKKILIISIALAVSFLGVFCFIVGMNFSRNLAESVGGVSTPSTVASTTAFTLTTTSQRILATSTRRTAFTVQPTNCTAANITYVAALKDAAATATNGLAVHSTTTERFIDDFSLPVSESSVQAITNTGTCTVIVTEWREEI